MHTHIMLNLLLSTGVTTNRQSIVQGGLDGASLATIQTNYIGRYKKKYIYIYIHTCANGQVSIPVF